ncbi:DUF2177 family protein [Rhodoferax ferrireducens]|uniref:DUF2177 family protein n=1 Tax=Rhodoferax ferrireducens TaxID=192843 RepID=UPI000E0DF630|nr:DUF2177 family protein [Rhodoferax ferrireducens]
MTKYLLAYLATAIAIVALDRFWLSVLARPLYQQGFGRPMAERPNVSVVLLFYALFAMGVMLFAVAPNEAEANWGNTFVAGALLGFFAYATYDLANPMKNWPVGVSVLDISMGSLFSSFSAGAGKTALDWVADMEQIFAMP